MCVRRLGATRLVFYELPGVRWLHIQNPGTTTNTGRRVSALLCALGSVVLRARHSSGFPLCSCVLGYRRPQGAGLWASFAPFSIVMQLLQESFLENNTPPKKGGKKEKKKKVMYHPRTYASVLLRPGWYIPKLSGTRHVFLLFSPLRVDQSLPGSPKPVVFWRLCVFKIGRHPAAKPSPLFFLL